MHGHNSNTRERMHRSFLSGWAVCKIPLYVREQMKSQHFLVHVCSKTLVEKKIIQFFLLNHTLKQEEEYSYIGVLKQRTLQPSPIVSELLKYNTIFKLSIV